MLGKRLYTCDFLPEPYYVSSTQIPEYRVKPKRAHVTKTRTIRWSVCASGQ